MEKKRHKNMVLFNSRATATMSVAFVLLILGIAAFIAIVAGTLTKNIKENLGYDICMVEDAEQQEVSRIHGIVSSYRSTLSATIHSPEELAKQWEEEMGISAVELCGVNPFSAIIEVKVRAGYASADSISKIAGALRTDPAVDSVDVHTDMIESINSNTKTILITLGIIGIALLIISFVLINNTIRLSIYARRFLIHTMKLVGATHSFIRRPFVVANIVNGIIAGIIASLLLWLLIYCVVDINRMSDGEELISATTSAIVFTSLTATGVVICWISAIFATNRYLAIDYDDMFD